MITAQNIFFIEQGRDLIRRLDDQLYCHSNDGQSCVGAHLRHVIDCFRCFQHGLESGQVDYDARQRNACIENDRAIADHALTEIAECLQNLAQDDVVRSLQVKVDTAAWDDPSMHWTISSVGRELQFLLSHTVHHYALIALLLRQQGFDPGTEFGVAPSTLEFLGKTKLQGKTVATSPAAVG